jgi:hypothetical protein
MYRVTVAVLLGAGALATAYVQYRRLGSHRGPIDEAVDLILAFMAEDLAVILLAARLTPP